MRVPKPTIMLMVSVLAASLLPIGSSQTELPPPPQPVGVGSCAVTESSPSCWFVCLDGEPVVVELWVGGVRAGTLLADCGATAECSTYSHCTDSSWPGLASAGLGTCTLSGLGGLPMSAYGTCGHPDNKGITGSAESLSLYPAAHLALGDQ